LPSASGRIGHGLAKFGFVHDKILQAAKNQIARNQIARNQIAQNPDRATEIAKINDRKE